MKTKKLIAKTKESVIRANKEDNIKQKAKETVFNREKIEDLKNEALRDIKKINNLNSLIQEFLGLYLNSEAEEKKKITKKDKEFVYNNIKEIFQFFIYEKKENLSADLKKYLNEKLTLLLNILLDLIDPEESALKLGFLLCKAFEVYELKNFHLRYNDSNSGNNSNNKVNTANNNVKKEDKNISERNKLDNFLYEKLIEKFLLNSELIESDNIKLLSEKLIKSLDLTHLFKMLKILSEKINLCDSLLEADVQDHQAEAEKKANFIFFNLYNFIISIPKFTEFKKYNKNITNSDSNKIFMIENSEFLDAENILNMASYEADNAFEGITDKKQILYFCFEKNLKKFYEILITKIVNADNVPNEIISNLLINLNKVILENLENPLIFSDFLINIYEKSKDKDFSMKVLSLSGLFVLITKYKLDYQNFYKMLYQSLCQTIYDGNKLSFIFDSKYRNRIFKIFEISLKPSSVPILVVLSFLKVINLLIYSFCFDNLLKIKIFIINILLLYLETCKTMLK